MDGRCSCRAVCDRLLTLLNEEVVEYIRLILRCGSLVWGGGVIVIVVVVVVVLILYCHDGHGQ